MDKLKRTFGKVANALIAFILVCLLAVTVGGCGDRSRTRDELPDNAISTPVNPDLGEGETDTDPGDKEDNGDETDPKKPDNDDNETEPTDPDDGDKQKPTDPDNPPKADPPKEDPPSWATDYTLPESDGVQSRLLEIYESEEKLFLPSGGKILRLACPRSGEIIKLNFAFTPCDYAKDIFEDCIAEFNEVFGVINPNYKFKLNFSPTEDDEKGDYAIKVITVSGFSGANTLGTAAYGIAGNYLYPQVIRLKENVPTDGTMIMSVFKHELMHMLGAGDAYNNSAATKDTVMQGYSLSGPFSFSVSDVAFLDALYRNPSNRYTAEYISEYIASYAETNTHTRDVNETAVYAKAFAELDKDKLIEQVAAAGYTDGAMGEAVESLAGDWAIDTDFGKSSVGFDELPRDNMKEGDTHYSGRFDVEAGKYLHGTQKYGSGLTSSMGIKYADYGGGILFAAPGGTANSTYFVRTGGYVYAFRTDGGFRDLPNLQFDLVRVYKVN